MIAFLTGASCSGKTIATEQLTRNGSIDGWTWLDIDDHATKPTAGHLAWLEWRMSELLVEWGQKEDEHLLVSGIVWPHKAQAVAARQWAEVSPFPQIGMMCLSVPDEVREERLRERLHDRDEGDVEEYLWYNRRLDRELWGQAFYHEGSALFFVEEHTPEELSQMVTSRLEYWA
jgi:hypothetical protein